jgi:hypothetical protein
MRLIKAKCYEGRCERNWYVSHYDSVNGSRLLRCIRLRKLAGFRDCPLAAIVGIRRGKAFAFGTAGGGFTRKSAGEAVERSDQDQHR